MSTDPNGRISLVDRLTSERLELRVPKCDEQLNSRPWVRHIGSRNYNHGLHPCVPCLVVACS